MTNEQVIQAFINGKEKAANNQKTLRIVSGRLVNYQTTIAQYYGNTLYINETKYSSTTSKIVNKLKQLAGTYKSLDTHYPEGTGDLI